MEATERIQSRMKNIRSVEPILAALRTISMGNWNRARKQKNFLDDYLLQIKTILLELSVYLPARITFRTAFPNSGNDIPHKTILLIVGSERGLCGGFNRALLKPAADYIQAGNAKSKDIEIWALGTRLTRYIKQEGWPLAWVSPLSVITLPSFDLAHKLMSRWLGGFQSGQLELINVLYNQPQREIRYCPAIIQLVPFNTFDIFPDESCKTWPPPIVETDIKKLVVQLVRQFMLIRIYACLLESAIAEHSSRYQLLEDATQNADRLTHELNQMLNISRRQEVNDELQILAVSAGLVR